MARIDWQDEEGQNLNRYKITPVEGEEDVFDLERRATITKAGTPIVKANMTRLVQDEDLEAVIPTEAEKSAWNAKATTATYTATITTTWMGTAAPYTQFVTVNGILAADTPIVDVVLSATAATARLQLEAWGMVSRIVTEDNRIVVLCLDDKPTTAIPIQLKVVR